MSKYLAQIIPTTNIKVKEDFQKLFGENCSVISAGTSELFNNELVHQVTTKYKNKLFQNIISENKNNYTVLSITTKRIFQNRHQPKVGSIDFPITAFEYQISINLETIHNFPFDKNKVIKIYDKMIESKISFDEII